MRYNSTRHRIVRTAEVNVGVTEAARAISITLTRLADAISAVRTTAIDISLVVVQEAVSATGHCEEKINVKIFSGRDAIVCL